MPSERDDLEQYLPMSEYLRWPEAQQLTREQLETLAAYHVVHGPASARRYRALAAAAVAGAADAERSTESAGLG